jgi:hypothetical protein
MGTARPLDRKEPFAPAQQLRIPAFINIIYRHDQVKGDFLAPFHFHVGMGKPFFPFVRDPCPVLPCNRAGMKNALVQEAKK